MEQLKQEIVKDTSEIVQDACKDALTTQVLQQTENIHGSKENYHKLIEGTLPNVPYSFSFTLSLSQNILMINKLRSLSRLHGISNSASQRY